MKKFIAILAILMLVPFTAFGLESLSDDVMDNTTGQAGVSIAADINIDMTMDTLAWGDADGVDSDASSANDGQGWIGLKNFNMDNLRMRLNPTLSTSAAGIAQIKLFTVDVATGTRPSGDAYTFVRLGLGSQRITMDSLTAQVQLGADNALGSELGDFAILGMTMDINGTSTVDISSHDGAGVTIDLNVTIDQIHINAMSWGDADGAGTGVIMYNSGVGGGTVGADGVLSNGDTTERGYVGIRDFQLNNMTITGQVLIDVVTLGTGLTPTAGLLYVYQVMQSMHYDGGTTGVLIRLNDLHIGIQNISGTCTLAATTALNPAVSGQDLGQFYMSNVQVNVNGWAVIFAH